MKRCAHGVFQPDDIEKGQPNRVCSVCTPEILTMESNAKHIIARNREGDRFEDLKA